MAVVGILLPARHSADGGAQESAAPKPSAQEMTPEQLYSRLLEHNRARESRLREYSQTRTYEMTNAQGKVNAKTVVRVEYHAPSTKTFTTQSEEGSWVIRSLVFKRLMDSELDTASGRNRQDSSIRPENYTLDVLGKEDVRGYHCYVADATPTRRDKYLFEGKVWIDDNDFAVVKIEGHPAKNPSFWIKRIDFVRQYQKIGDFWLPWRDESTNEVRVYGKKTLSIEHNDFTVNGEQSAGTISLQ